MTRHAVRLLTLVMGALLAWSALAAASYAAESGAASGEFCAQDEGVSVVVDASVLDGSITRSCVPAAATLDASQVFDGAQVRLTPVTSVPGAVCQVDDLPAETRCAVMPPADAYWGLFVATDSGTWDYAPVGVDELQLSPGDYVGFAWQTSAEATLPAVEPVVSAEAERSATSDPSPGEGLAPQATQGTNAEESADEGVREGTPVWIFYIVIVTLAVAGLGFGLLRNRRRSRE